MKKSTLIWIAVSSLMAGALIYLFTEKAKKARAGFYGNPDRVLPDAPNGYTSPQDSIDEMISPIDQGTAQGFNSLAFPLKKGARGSEVVELQKYLNRNSYFIGSRLSEDGVFGDKTKAAVINMQTNPKSEIQDYLGYAIFGANFTSGEVSLEFYEKFIA